MDTGDKLQTAVSTMTIFPERSDNGALYVCRASNPASEGTVLQTTVQLSVMRKFLHNTISLLGFSAFPSIIILCLMVK